MTLQEEVNKNLSYKMIFPEIYVKIVNINDYGEDSLLAERFLFHLITNYCNLGESQHGNCSPSFVIEHLSLRGTPTDLVR